LAPKVCGKFRKNWIKTAIVRTRTDRQTDRNNTDYLTIWLTLCYGNRTDY